MAGARNRTRSYKAAAKKVEQLLNTFNEQFLAECMVCFKDPAYSQEKEWRAIVFAKQELNLKFRTRSGAVVPYIELDLSRHDGPDKGMLKLSKVYQGPTLEPEQTTKSIQMLVKTSACTDSKTRITRSAVPFRNV